MDPTKRSQSCAGIGISPSPGGIPQFWGRRKIQRRGLKAVDDGIKFDLFNILIINDVCLGTNFNPVVRFENWDNLKCSVGIPVFA